MGQQQAASLGLGIGLGHGADAEAQGMGKVALRRQAAAGRQDSRRDVPLQRVGEAVIQRAGRRWNVGAPDGGHASCLGTYGLIEL